MSKSNDELAAMLKQLTPRQLSQLMTRTTNYIDAGDGLACPQGWTTTIPNCGSEEPMLMPMPVPEIDSTLTGLITDLELGKISEEEYTETTKELKIEKDLEEEKLKEDSEEEKLKEDSEEYEPK